MDNLNIEYIRNNGFNFTEDERAKIGKQKLLQEQMASHLADTRWLLTLCFHDTSSLSTTQRNYALGVYEVAIDQFFRQVSRKLWGSKTLKRIAYKMPIFETGSTGCHPHFHVAISSDLLGTESSRRFNTYQSMKQMMYETWKKQTYASTLEYMKNIDENGYHHWIKPVHCTENLTRYLSKEIPATSI